MRRAYLITLDRVILSDKIFQPCCACILPLACLPPPKVRLIVLWFGVPTRVTPWTGLKGSQVIRRVFVHPHPTLYLLFNEAPNRLRDVGQKFSPAVIFTGRSVSSVRGRSGDLVEYYLCPGRQSRWIVRTTSYRC
jgi:hypothetical protein